MNKALLLGLCALGATALVARANIELVDPITAAANGGFTWDYSASVTQGETVTNGSTFTIYDFGNFNQSSNLQPAGWTFSFSLTTTPPAGLTVTDNPNLANLTWTYTGATPINGAQALGDFSVIAATNLARDGEFAALATSTSQGSPDVNKNNIAVPVPEASTLLPLLGVCGASIAANIPSLLRRRKKS
jgi:hypothetical protein